MAKKTYPEEVIEEELKTFPVEIKPEEHPIPPVEIVKELPMAVNQTQQPETVVKEAVPDFIRSLEVYVKNMNVGVNITRTNGGKEQHNMLKTIKSIITQASSQAEFNKQWNQLLAFILQYRNTIFSEGMIFRFPESWAGTESEYELCRKILHVIINTCDYSTRSAKMKYINLNSAISAGLTDAERNKLINFYE